MSYWTSPSNPVEMAVIEPMIKTKDKALVDNSNSGDILANIKTPAVTIVAAWISAEIGVGPSIESGSHTCNGICADLPIAPPKRSKQAKVRLDISKEDESLTVLEVIDSALLKIYS